MHLTLAHRLTALNLLPSEGTFVTLRTVRDAQHALSPSPDEIARFQITQDGNQVRWIGDSTAEVALSTAAVGLLKDALAKKDADGTLTLALLDLSDALGAA